jgi:hypothetical protein
MVVMVRWKYEREKAENGVVRKKKKLLKYNSNIRFWLGTGSEGYRILKHSI